MLPPVPFCPLSDGYWQVADGKIVNATFWLRMLERPATAVSTLTLRLATPEQSPAIQDAFVRIGADSLWDRAAQLAGNPTAWPWGSADRLYQAFDADQRFVGLAEICDHAGEGARDVEISYIGVFPELTGHGLGRRLLNSVLALIWQDSPHSVFLHTCNTDHPRALPLYRSCGFRPFRAGLQIMDDPRRLGLLPRTAAAHVPLVASMPDT